MPLTFAAVGKQNTIHKVGGKREVRQHLENLGFIAGESVTVLSEFGGSVIVRVKESRVAISKALASKILV